MRMPRLVRFNASRNRRCGPIRLRMRALRTHERYAIPLIRRDEKTLIGVIPTILILISSRRNARPCIALAVEAALLIVGVSGDCGRGARHAKYCASRWYPQVSREFH